MDVIRARQPVPLPPARGSGSAVSSPAGHGAALHAAQIEFGAF